MVHVGVIQVLEDGVYLLGMERQKKSYMEVRLLRLIIAWNFRQLSKAYLL